MASLALQLLAWALLTSSPIQPRLALCERNGPMPQLHAAARHPPPSPCSTSTDAGRASFELHGLRYAGLNASSFSSSMRWEGDVVKLEETVLTQANSRWAAGLALLLGWRAAWADGWLGKGEEGEGSSRRG